MELTYEPCTSECMMVLRFGDEKDVAELNLEEIELLFNILRNNLFGGNSTTLAFNKSKV